VWLEAHRQNQMLYRPAEDATPLQRFGDLTVAVAGQVLVLLIVFMAYAAFSGEREAGTLKQLLGLGLSPRALLLGKAMGIAGALLAVLGPAALLVLGAAIALAPAGEAAAELARAALFRLPYGAYLGAFLFLSLAVSARCRRSRTALGVLLVFWGFTVLAAPRGLSDMAKALYPTAPAAGLEQALETRIDRAVGRVPSACARRSSSAMASPRPETCPSTTTAWCYWPTKRPATALSCAKKGR
jgi:ABC-2 type transport system permease protein